MSRAGDERRRAAVPATTWALLALAPAAWALFTGLAWILPEPACEAGASYAPHLAAGVAVAVALAGVVGGHAALARRRRSAPEDSQRSLAEFVGTVGVLVGALLVVGLVIAWAYVATHDPCW